MSTMLLNAAATHAACVAAQRFDDVAAPLLLQRLLDEIDYGLLLLDADGRLMLANRMARLECAAGRALARQGEQVRAARAQDAPAWTSALADAARGRRTLLCIGGDDAVVTLAVIPLALGMTRPCALLIVGRRRLCETLSIEMFARHHRLTGAEMQVLQALCRGLEPSDIASQFGVTMATIRTQVTAIRSKTDASSIRELVRRVAALPPMLPALHQPVPV